MASNRAQRCVGRFVAATSSLPATSTPGWPQFFTHPTAFQLTFRRLHLSLSLLFFNTSSTAVFAKHVNDKAAKWAASKRPKKSRPSQKNRKPLVYEIHSYQKPPEYTITGN